MGNAVDAQAVIRAMVAAKTEVLAAAGNRVYGGVKLPGGYTVGDGPAVLLNIRGGNFEYSDVVLRPSVQMRCWGADAAAAWRMNKAVMAGCHAHSGPGVTMARCEVLGTLVEDPETGWSYVISFWTFWVQNP